MTAILNCITSDTSLTRPELLSAHAHSPCLPTLAFNFNPKLCGMAFRPGLVYHVNCKSGLCEQGRVVKIVALASLRLSLLCMPGAGAPSHPEPREE